MKRLSLAPDAIQRARDLRKNMTDAERKLWCGLRATFPDIKWRRQVPLGPYFADFACYSAKLIVELDGGQHDERLKQDAIRTRFLASQGFRVIRFWNNDVVDNLEGVLTAIANALRGEVVA